MFSVMCLVSLSVHRVGVPPHWASVPASFLPAVQAPGPSLYRALVHPKMFKLVTARKRSLQWLCFYICLSVILFTGKGCLGPGPGGRLGVWLGEGVSRSTPGGSWGSGWGGLQAHTQWGGWGVWLVSVQAHTQRGGRCPGPHPGGSRPRLREVYTSMH